uniref:Uncharacterized protein n=1 Tax=Staphylococcus phage 184DA TaxID=3110532 RepID=A0AAU6MXF7_9CAUD
MTKVSVYVILYLTIKQIPYTSLFFLHCFPV